MVRRNSDPDVETSPPPPYTRVAETVAERVEHVPEVSARRRDSQLWWRKTQCWVTLVALVALVLFGTIFGAVSGVKKSHSRSVYEQPNFMTS